MHANNDSTPRFLRHRQTLTAFLLFGGYAALYFCRADLSVGAPLIIDELKLRGVDHGALIGRVCETTYGEVFDVRSVPLPENLAYSDLGLGLHTDNPYREPSHQPP